jgi:hypothetical protein
VLAVLRARRVNSDGQVVGALSEAVDTNLPVLVTGIGDDQSDGVVQAQVSVRVLEAGRVSVVANVQVAIAAEVIELHDDGIDGLGVEAVKVPLVVVNVATDLLAGEQLASHLFAVDTAEARVTSASVAEHATAVQGALGGAVGDGSAVQGPRETRVSEGVETKVDPLVGHIYNLQAEVVVNTSLGVVKVDARGDASFLNVNVNVAVSGFSDVPDKFVGSRTDLVVDPAVLGEMCLIFSVRSSDSVDRNSAVSAFPRSIANTSASDAISVASTVVGATVASGVRVEVDLEVSVLESEDTDVVQAVVSFSRDNKREVLLNRDISPVIFAQRGQLIATNIQIRITIVVSFSHNNGDWMVECILGLVNSIIEPCAGFNIFVVENLSKSDVLQGNRAISTDSVSIACA